LDPATREAIVTAHRRAGTSITSLADSVPTTVDAGYATPDVLAIIAAVVATADDIALVNEAAAAQVEAVAEGLGQTDADVAANFRGLAAVVP
jgi:hypothetical protein